MMKHDRVPQLYVNTYEYLHSISLKYSGRNALRWKEDDIYYVKTYQEMMDDIFAFAVQLEKRNLIKGHIALVGEVSYEWVVGFLAIIYTGSVAVPLNYMLSGEELIDDMIFADVDAALIGDMDAQTKLEVCSKSGIDFMEMNDMLLRDELVRMDDYSQVKADSLACIIFTTGTTGKKKGVMLSQQNLMAGATQVAATTDVRKQRKAIATLPAYHIFELTGTYLGGLYCGGELFLGRGVKYFARNIKNESPEIIEVVPLFLEAMKKKIEAAIEKRGKRKYYCAQALCKFLSGIGINVYRMIFHSIYDELGGAIKTFVVGGASLNPEIALFFNNIGIKVLPGYGLTETTGAITCNRDNNVNIKSVGKAMPFSELRIKDGEVQVRGKNVMLGYYKELELTKEVFDDGWFCTGDLGYMDEEGFLYLTGRKKNLIILSDGANINPEIWEEEIRSSCEAISEIIIFEQDNKVVTSIYAENEVREEAEKAIDRFNAKIPYAQRIQKIFFSDEPLPKTSTGKIKRFYQ